MSAGSAASNLGYGNIAPLSDINGRYVNVDNSHSPATFGNIQISGTPPGPLPGLGGTKDNVDAAASIFPGSSILIGGAKKLKKKINNITKKYKMSVGSRKRKNLKKKIRSKYTSKSRAFVGKRKTRNSRKKSRKQKGGYTPPGLPGIPYPPGYTQYQNNLPLTPTYSVGGLLLAKELGLANPPPIEVLPNCTNCTDNYNHYTGTGFPSRGH